MAAIHTGPPWQADNRYQPEEAHGSRCTSRTQAHPVDNLQGEQTTFNFRSEP